MLSFILFFYKSILLKSMIKHIMLLLLLMLFCAFFMSVIIKQLENFKKRTTKKHDRRVNPSYKGNILYQRPQF
uniref:Uncharacterized protein n=1 Tax=Anguilla anguilla TaxID=7936 RepID=A0A0E9UAZ4_ANGAN